MKYITKRTSETGKKFEEIEIRRKKIQDNIEKLGDKLGFRFYCYDSLSVIGISAAQFDKEPDMTVYKKEKGTRNVYSPRFRNKQGKEIYQMFKDCGSISNGEINACIGFHNPFTTIGFDFSNKEYIGFEVLEKWKVKVPNDCIEITVTEYNKIFNP
jgi:hypothetical protein